MSFFFGSQSLWWPSHCRWSTVDRRPLRKRCFYLQSQVEIMMRVLDMSTSILTWEPRYLWSGRHSRGKNNQTADPPFWSLSLSWPLVRNFLQKFVVDTLQTSHLCHSCSFFPFLINHHLSPLTTRRGESNEKKGQGQKSRDSDNEASCHVSLCLFTFAAGFETVKYFPNWAMSCLLLPTVDFDVVVVAVVLHFSWQPRVVVSTSMLIMCLIDLIDLLSDLMKPCVHT